MADIMTPTSTRDASPATAEPVLRLDAVSKRFDDVVAVDAVSLELARGELISFVGPSGCGKTTLLRMIGGFLDSDDGAILLNGRRVEHLPPERRPTGMVFQAYALFPHMTVEQNVAYGLSNHKVPRGRRRERVREALESVRLDGLEGRKPRELSGGQQQRVALARCLVLRPELLLLDEPLSNLDANLRTAMRDEIKRLKDELDLTVVFVTHDQDEALSISDRVLVLRDGRVQQTGTPEDVYHRPRNEFVATFAGLANMLTGPVQRDGSARILDAGDGFRLAVDPSSAETALDESTSEEVAAVLRPESVDLRDDGRYRAVVVTERYHGRFIRYVVRCGAHELLIDDPAPAMHARRAPGEELRFDVPDNLPCCPVSGAPTVA